MKVTLRGSTSVVENHLEDDEAEVTSTEVLKMIASKNDQLQSLCDEDSTFSQYLHDGSELADAIQQRIKPGGWVSLVYDDAAQKLFVETTYESDEELTEEEVEFLVRETIGQWSDGAGGGAMDDFSEIIEPYYVELETFEADEVIVSTE